MQIAADAEAAMNSCMTTYSDFVENQYVRAMAPTGAERDAKLQSLVDCLDEIGVLGVTVDMGETEFVKAIVANLPEEELTRGFACMDAHASLFI